MRRPATPGDVERICAAPTAILTDGMVRLKLGGWMDDVVPLQRGVRMGGRARTILFGPLRGADQSPGTSYGFIRSLSKGEVLVMSAGGRSGPLLGDNMVKACEIQGLNGIVTDATSIDVEAIGSMKVPVFFRGPGTRPAGVEVMGRDVPISCGGAQVRPGDLVVGDPDGVVVIPASRAAEVAAELDDIYAIERDLIAAVENRVPLDELERILKRKRAPRKA